MAVAFEEEKQVANEDGRTFVDAGFLISYYKQHRMHGTAKKPSLTTTQLWIAPLHLLCKLHSSGDIPSRVHATR